jgi:hypothetical protein
MTSADTWRSSTAKRIHIGSKEAGPRVAAVILVVATCRRLKISIRAYLGSVRAVINERIGIAPHLSLAPFECPSYY